MRELTYGEASDVGGASLKLTTPLTWSLLNNVGNFNTVTKLAVASFSAGYAVGTFLNETFGISDRIVAALPE
jgi:hypothetical protein